MFTFFVVLLALDLVAIVAVLLVGVISMGHGGEFNRKYGNKLMRARVALQGLAVLLVAACFFTKPS